MALRTWATRLTLAALLAVSAVGFAPLTLGTATAANNGAWSATPTVEAQQAPRQYFFLDMSDGQTIEDSVTISNFEARTLRLDVFPSDAYNVSEGAGFAVTEIDQKVSDVGSWITLPKKVVFVPASKVDKKGDLVPGTVTLPFKLTVPKGATPGDHAGAISTLEETPPPIGGESQVRVRRQLAVRTYVRVAGPLTTSLAVQRVSLDAVAARLPFVGRQGTATVEYQVKNNGNTRVTPNRVLELNGIFGRNLHTSLPGTTPEILPGSTVVLRESFVGMPVLDRVTARVELSANEGRVTAAGDTSVWVVSLTFLILLFVFIVLVIVVLRFGPLRKRRQEPQLEEPVEPVSVESAT